MRGIGKCGLDILETMGLGPDVRWRDWALRSLCCGSLRRWNVSSRRRSSLLFRPPSPPGATSHHGVTMSTIRTDVYYWFLAMGQLMICSYVIICLCADKKKLGYWYRGVAMVC